MCATRSGSCAPALTGEKVDAEYETFTVRGFRLGRRVEQPPPIYVAALRPGMLRLAGREADGAILNWLSAEDVSKVVPEVGPGKDIVARIFVCPTEDAERARYVGRIGIAAYLNVAVYAAFHEWLGRGPLLEAMWTAWRAGDRKGGAGRHPRRGRRRARGPRLARASAGPMSSATSTTASRSPSSPCFPEETTWPTWWRTSPPDRPEPQPTGPPPPTRYPGRGRRYDSTAARAASMRACVEGEAGRRQLGGEDPLAGEHHLRGEVGPERHPEGEAGHGQDRRAMQGPAQGTGEVTVGDRVRERWR